MKFTLNWLKKYVDTGTLSPQELADQLTMLGLEVDSVTPLFEELAALKTGLVVTADKHPNADKLTVCQVQVGEEIHQIVCGAPNVRKDLNVVVALPGTVLPGNFKISKSKIRGVASHGMICSERELGLSNDHDGIMELPDGTVQGQSFIKVMELEDIGIEVDLTPNRPDCASVIGIGREVAAITGNKLALPVTDGVIEKDSTEFSVTIESPELCPRYAARLIKNVTVAPSPWWLKRTLLSVGLRPINNIVDITNFVMLEYGQPLHAFDFDTLADKKIIIRTPSSGEKEFTTLDNSSHTLTENTLLICDGQRPAAVAGVMGGLNSEVTNGTINILLESACFNPISVRRTARNLNISTDASYRFERGVDPDGTINALNRAAELIRELGQGEAPDDGIDCYPGRTDGITLPLSISRTNGLIGVTMSLEEISKLLISIELPCRKVDDDTIEVSVPSFRVDIVREADLVEEVARLFGYNNVPTSLPKVELSYPEKDADRIKRLDIAEQLVSAGYTEAINYSFISTQFGEQLELEDSDPRKSAVALLNPLSEDQAVMRTTLLPGLLENVKRNINFQVSDISLFEVGKVFFPISEGKQPLEKNMLAGVIAGRRSLDASALYCHSENIDIFDAKGAVEFILRQMELVLDGDKKGLHFSLPTSETYETYVDPAYSLLLFHGQTKLGSLGKLRTQVLRAFSIKSDVYYFDLDYDTLCKLQQASKKFKSLPVFPAVKRDIALLVKESVSAGELHGAIQSSREKLIESSEIFDIFRGEKLPSGFKSVALAITYRSPTKTLTEKNVEKAHSKIVTMLTDKFGGTFRNA